MFMPGRPGRPMSATPLRNIMQALFGVTANIREVRYIHKKVTFIKTETMKLVLLY